MKEKTECSCDFNYPEGGYCEKHGINKTGRQCFLCKNSKKCFDLFEQVSESENERPTLPQLEILTGEWGELSGEDVTEEVKAIRKAHRREQGITECDCNFSMNYDVDTGRGFCDRHKCWKDDEQKKLCQTDMETFTIWETGNGPGQEELTDKDRELLQEKIKREQPGLFRKIWNFSKALKSHVSDGARTVSDEVYEKRLLECDQCVYREGNRCLHASCGCNLTQKAKWNSEKCPVGRWQHDD